MDPKQYPAYPYLQISQKFGVSHAYVYKVLEDVKGNLDYWLKEGGALYSAVAYAFLDERTRQAQVIQQCQT